MGVLAAAVVVLAAGCGQDSKTGLPYESPPDAEQLVKADEIARTYLRAAASGDAERVCAMRTRGALRELGGRAACERQPTGIEVFHHGQLSGDRSRRRRGASRRHERSGNNGSSRG